MWTQRIARHAAAMRRRHLTEALQRVDVPRRIKALKRRLPEEQHQEAISKLWNDLQSRHETTLQPPPARQPQNQLALLENKPIKPPRLRRKPPARATRNSLKPSPRPADERQQELFQ